MQANQHAELASCAPAACAARRSRAFAARAGKERCSSGGDGSGVLRAASGGAWLGAVRGVGEGTVSSAAVERRGGEQADARGRGNGGWFTTTTPLRLGVLVEVLLVAVAGTQVTGTWWRAGLRRPRARSRRRARWPRRARSGCPGPSGRPTGSRRTTQHARRHGRTGRPGRCRARSSRPDHGPGKHASPAARTYPPAGSHPPAAGPPAWPGTARTPLTASGSGGWPRQARPLYLRPGSAESRPVQEPDSGYLGAAPAVRVFGRGALGLWALPAAACGAATLESEQLPESPRVRG